MSKNIPTPKLEDILGGYASEGFRQALGTLEAVVHGVVFTMESSIPQAEWDGSKSFHPVASALRSAFYQFHERLRPILEGKGDPE